MPGSLYISDINLFSIKIGEILIILLNYDVSLFSNENTFWNMYSKLE